MDTKKMELSMDETAKVNGGSISEFFQAMGKAWNIFWCERGHHDYAWNGEMGELHTGGPYSYWRYATYVCKKCGKKCYVEKPVPGNLK